MSVQTALDALNRELRNDFDLYEDAQKGYAPLFQALILEAQAEMPCLTDHSTTGHPLCGTKPADWNNDPRRELWTDGELRLCASCVARAKLAELKEPVA